MSSKTSSQHEGDELQPREHRAGAWVLLVVGVAALGLGLYQWQDSIVKAFDRGPSEFKSEEQVEQERLDDLKTKDTDGDGITDFDESYVFNTSPYLEDSDSDGISDKEELENSTDPNCPEGKECGPLGEGVGADIPEKPSSEPDAPADPNSEDLKLLESVLNPSPDEIRKLLLEAGISSEQLENVDDETLLELYKESLQEVQTQNP